MSDKDFAYTDPSPYPQDEKRNNKPLLITSLALLCAGLCFSAGFFVGEERGLEAHKSNKHITLLKKLKTQQTELEALKQEAEKWHQQEANTSLVGDLTFYNELPEQSVMPEPLDATFSKNLNMNIQHADPVGNLTTNKISILDGNIDDMQAVKENLDAIIASELNKPAMRFRIQVASFKKRQDAIKLVSKIQDIGLHATSQRIDIPSIGVRYRVYTTDYNQQNQAVRAKALIKDKLKLTGIIIQNG